jgi:hypothetical protein
MSLATDRIPRNPRRDPYYTKKSGPTILGPPSTVCSKYNFENEVEVDSKKQMTATTKLTITTKE